MPKPLRDLYESVGVLVGKMGEELFDIGIARPISANDGPCWQVVAELSELLGKIIP